jgi:uncharacterized membrane protein YbhN (UPF0104 family)
MPNSGNKQSLIQDNNCGAVVVKRIARYLPTATVLVLGAIYVYFEREELSPLFSLSCLDVFLLAVPILVFFILTGYTFSLLLSLLSIKLTMVELIGLTFLTNFCNYLAPTSPGAAIKAIYLKGQKGLSYSSFSAILAANSFLIFFMSGATGLILILFLWLQTNLAPHSLIAISALLLAFSLLPFVFRFRTIHYQGRVWAIINNALVGFQTIKSQKTKLVAIGVSILAQYFLSAWVLVLAYHSLGQPISFTLALIIGVFASISNFFTLTPNNLGIQEMVMAYLYSISGMSFSDGLMGAVLIRALHIILTFALSPVFIYFLLRSSSLSLGDILPWRNTGCSSCK